MRMMESKKGGERNLCHQHGCALFSHMATILKIKITCFSFSGTVIVV